MKKLDYFIVLLIPIVFIISFLGVYFSTGFESYNYIYPHIDTKFTAGFSQEKFAKIKRGMSKAEVELVLGEPFSYYSIDGYCDDFITKEFHLQANYSYDGKFEFSDFAWEHYGVYYDKDTMVKTKKSRWYYD